MLLPPAPTLKVFSTEFTNNVLWLLVFSRDRPLEKRSHHLHLVRRQILPIFTVNVTFLAVEMFGVCQFVALHVLECVEALLTAWIRAFERSRCHDAGRV